MVEKLTEEQRKVLMIWVCLGMILTVLLLIIGSKKVGYKNNYELDNEYLTVRDYSRYYTITKIIDKYYTAINDERYEVALNMLDSKYVSEKSINTSNIKETLNYDAKVSFSGGLMCSKRFAKGFTSYYVIGKVIGTNVDKEFDTVYYEVVLDEMNMLFSIKPVESSMFGGACNA